MLLLPESSLAWGEEGATTHGAILVRVTTAKHLRLAFSSIPLVVDGLVDQGIYLF